MACDTERKLWEAIATLKDPTHYILAAKIPAIAKTTVAACYALGGAKHGVIDDPRQCKFDPTTIQCKSGEEEECSEAHRHSERNSEGLYREGGVYVRVMKNAWFRRGEVYTNFVRRRMDG